MVITLEEGKSNARKAKDDIEIIREKIIMPKLFSNYGIFWVDQAIRAVITYNYNRSNNH